jgi:hypothetical protein
MEYYNILLKVNNGLHAMEIIKVRKISCLQKERKKYCGPANHKNFITALLI